MDNQTLDDVELDHTCYELQLKYQNLKMQSLIAEVIRRDGINRSILSLCNSNHELDNFLGEALPAVESLDENQTLPTDFNQKVYNKLVAGLEDNIGNLDVYQRHMLMPYIAGFRWFQKVLTSYDKYRSQLNEALATADEVARARPSNNLEIKNVVSLKEISKLCDGTSEKLRDTANKNLSDMQHWSLSEGNYGNIGSEVAAESLELKGKAFALRRKCSTLLNHSRTMTLSQFGSISELKALIKYGLRMIDSIINMDQTYHGYFITGWRQGKLQVLLDSLTWGVAGTLVRANVIDIATLSWQTMSSATGADKYIIEAIVHNTKRLAMAIR